MHTCKKSSQAKLEPRLLSQISEQLFENFRDAGSLARVSLVSKHNDLRGRGLQAEQVLAVVRCSLNFVAVTFGTDLLFTASCSRHMPFVFARLLSPRREDVQSTLRHLELFFWSWFPVGRVPDAFRKLAHVARNEIASEFQQELQELSHAHASKLPDQRHDAVALFSVEIVIV